MYILDQNKKILLSAGTLFVLSFTVMLFFLNRYSDDLNHGQADVLKHDVEEHQEEGVEQEDWSKYIDSHDTGFITTADGYFTFANKRFTKLIDLDEDYVNELLFDYVKLNDLSKLVRAETDIIQSRESKDSIGPVSMINGDEEATVMLDAEPILNEEEQVEHIIFTVTDLTEKTKKPKENSNDPLIKEIPDENSYRLTAEKTSL